MRVAITLSIEMPLLRQNAGIILWGYSFRGVPQRNTRRSEFKLASKLGHLRSAKILACCLLVVPLVGTVAPPVPRSSRPPLLETPAERTASRAAVLAMLRSATDLFRARPGRVDEGGPAAMGRLDLLRRGVVPDAE